MSLLTLCQAAARQLNLPGAGRIVGNTDDETACCCAWRAKKAKA